MTLLEVGRSRASRDFGKPLAVNVFEHSVRHNGIEIRIAGGEVEIEEAIVVEVTEIASHRRIDLIEAG